MITRRAALAASALALLGCDPAPVVKGGFAGVAHERGHLLRSRRDWPPPASTRRAQVVIAGGGVAGLAAARALRLRGVEDMALLELEDSAGGNSRAGLLEGLPCPLGAHYLPVPGDSAPDVQNLLEELGLRQRVAGRWIYDERHLCHSPQERLYMDGQWHEGLLPMHGVSPGTLAQYRRFAQAVALAQKQSVFAIPAGLTRPNAAQLVLDAQGFAAWLDRQELTDAHLRWYLDYCCSDDYGAGIDTVSAWAGIHYFASRHGFHVPGDDAVEREGLLTWPEGNAWLAKRLEQPLGERLRTGQAVIRIAQAGQGVEVDAIDAATGTVTRWQARECVVALPVFIAARIMESPPSWLMERAARTRYSPWAVANLLLRGPLDDQPGAPPSWDNVVYGAQGLGYVDATHQKLDPTPGPTVLTCYFAPGEKQRSALLDAPWQHWRDQAVAGLLKPHPDLTEKLTRVEVTRYGHAMAIPVPGMRAASHGSVPRAGRISFAHADWAGYSIFEEAFTLGHLAGGEAAKNLNASAPRSRRA